MLILLGLAELLGLGDAISAAGPAPHRGEGMLAINLADNTVRPRPAVNVQRFAVRGERYNRRPQGPANYFRTHTR